MITGARVPMVRGVDFTMMYAAHDAFARDLQRISEACVRGKAFTPSTYAGWQLFVRQLTTHHTAEDASLWPGLRTRSLRDEQVQVLDAMEREHARVDVHLEHIESAFADCNGDALATSLRALTEGLTAHLRHEEEDALPLVAGYLGSDGWDAFVHEIRTLQGGLRAGAQYLPWVLDGASDDMRAGVLRLLPLPARVLCRRVWEPKYRRRSWWYNSVDNM